MSICPACASPVTEVQRFCPGAARRSTGRARPAAPAWTSRTARPARPPAPGRPRPTPSPGPERTPSSGPRRPARRAVRARHGPRRPLPHHRAPRPRRNGRGLPGRRPEARPAGRPQVPAARRSTRTTERLARFYREVRVARQVSHPAVCRVYDVGEAEGHLFLSMELVDGENLSSLLRRIGRLPPDKALDIARQLCAGLAAAHEKGVLHRDLKPANVMLDGQGNVRITDFGLAGLAESLREEDVRSGTPVLHVARAAAGARGERPQRHLRPRPRAVRARTPAAARSRARRSPSSSASTATSGRSSRRPSWPASTPRSSGRSSPASRRSRGAAPPPRSSSPRC